MESEVNVTNLPSLSYTPESLVWMALWMLPISIGKSRDIDFP